MFYICVLRDMWTKEIILSNFFLFFFYSVHVFIKSRFNVNALFDPNTFWVFAVSVILCIFLIPTYFQSLIPDKHKLYSPYNSNSNEYLKFCFSSVPVTHCFNILKKSVEKILIRKQSVSKLEESLELIDQITHDWLYISSLRCYQLGLDHSKKKSFYYFVIMFLETRRCWLLTYPYGHFEY